MVANQEIQRETVLQLMKRVYNPKPATKRKREKLMIRKISVAFVMILALSVTAFAQKGAKKEMDKDEKKEEMKLSDKSFDALMQEMHTVVQNVGALATSIALGEWETVSKQAKKIEASFILNKKMSEKELKDLHAALPAGFLEIDHKFHADAGKLAAAADGKDHELVSFYFYKVMEGCIACHAGYASDAFPGFSHPKPKMHDK